MKAIIYFIDKEVPTMELYGDNLGTYEVGSFTNVKDYGQDHKKLASIPTINIQFIQFFESDDNIQS